MSHFLKDIAVFFEDSEKGERILAVAADLAARQQAHLIGVCAIREDKTLPSVSFAKGEAIEEVIRRNQDTNLAHILRTGQRLEKAAAAHGVTAEFRIIPYTQHSSESAFHSLYCDLLIVSEPPAGVPLDWSTERILEQTGVPVLMVPDSWTGRSLGNHIVLAWNASRQARRAVADSLPLLTHARKVDLLVVDGQDDDERFGEVPGSEMAAYLARHGVEVELHQITSSGAEVGDTILAHAQADGADLIVFGAYSRPRLLQTFLGGVSKTLLERASLPLFVSH